jgi:outer membrane lipoprotein carrier protein
MKPVLLLVAALLLFFPTVVLAEDASLDVVIEALEKPFRAGTPAAAAIQDFQADFSQRSSLVSLEREQRGHGWVEVRFQQQSGDQVPLAQFRWKYDQPNNQEIVSDAETLWVYVPENNQVIQSTLAVAREPQGEDPMAFLTGLGNLSRDFSIDWADPNHDQAGNYVLRMRPRRASALIHEMQIVVDRTAVDDLVSNDVTGRRLPIVSSMVTDPNGNTTLIEFSRTRVNRGIDGKTFRFVIPPGVDVVRPTGQGPGF